MRSFPFTNYDFFGYIASGFVFLFAVDHVLSLGWMTRPAWTAAEGVFAAACAYGIGHLLAGGASATIERRLVRQWLGPPTLHLFEAGNRQGLVRQAFRRIYPSYFEPLPAQTRGRILDKAKVERIGEPGEALFWLAFSTAKVDKAASKRMGDFLNNYGLCRNLSFTALVCVPMLCVAAVSERRWTDLWWALAAAFLGVGMLLRYLKFYRHYSVEVFTTYAHAKPKRAVSTKKALE